MSTRGTVGDLLGVRSVGSLLAPDLLVRLAEGKSPSGTPVPGLDPRAYHLYEGESLRDAAEGAWARLTGAWRVFRETLDRLPPDDPAVSMTRNRWLLPLLSELGYGRVPTQRAPLHIGDQEFRVSHLWGDVPLHLLGARVDLDHRTAGVAGAAGAAPRAMLQLLLNLSPDYQWGIVSNGLKLRLLRDATSMSIASYVEFDLEAIFDGELLPEFTLLWRLLHQSRLEPLLPSDGSEATPGDCWLERWREHAIREGERALTKLGDGVERAICELGVGFLTHPGNGQLRELIAAGSNGNGRSGLTARGFYRLLLRLVYRLLFLLVAEERDALHPRDADPVARARYSEYFSVRRLRDLAGRRRGGPHGDQWEALRVVFASLGREDGLPDLALRGLGGLFEPGSLGVLEASAITNSRLLVAMQALSLFRHREAGQLTRVDYRNLGSDELGGVYESLLELEPRIELPERDFALESLAGNQRKSTGSYYTPDSLTDLLLAATLDPLLDEASDQPDPEPALLAITVCDPACGSGHFLVAAARRIATRLAAYREDEAVPSEDGLQHALRQVVDACVYGVDRNPMAVELAKVSLWLEAMEPGAPFAFLDAQIREGDALLGAVPALVVSGIPDRAFSALEGDDTAVARLYGSQNRAERSHGRGLEQGSLFEGIGTNLDTAAELHAVAEQIGTISGDDLAAVHRARRRWRAFEESPARRHARLVADAWCAAFVWPKHPTSPPPPTQRILDLLTSGSDQDTAAVPAETIAEISRLARQYRFFHWHLEFPAIFEVPADGDAAGTDPVTGMRGGFTCIAGNPPWDVVELEEKKFFRRSAPDIADAPTAARRREMIRRLRVDNPGLYEKYQDAKREVDGVRHMLADSQRYPGTGRGRVNLYATFAELATTVLAPKGRAGVIVPTQIATGDTTSAFFAGLVHAERLAALHDFENEDKLFPDVHNQTRFCVLAINGRARHADEVAFSFSARHPSQVAESMFRLKPDEITLLNPNTGNCPVFRTRRDADITLGIYRRHPVLVRETSPASSPWGARFTQGLFNMASGSALFRTAAQLRDEMGGTFDGYAWHAWELREERLAEPELFRFLPLYEAKMVHHFDHRFSTYAGATKAQLNKGTLPRVTAEAKQDPVAEALPRYWIREDRVNLALTTWTDTGWLLGWRDVARSVDSRTFITSVVPSTAVGDKFLLLHATAKPVAGLLAMLASYAFDFVTRQKVSSSSLKFYLTRQLPVPPPNAFAAPTPWTGEGSALAEWITPRVLELVYTSWSVEAFARDLADNGPPYVWNEARRTELRAELDAAAFHVYGLERDEVEHVMDSFFVVRDSEVRSYGEFRSKRLILERYDAMAAGSATPYRSKLDPPAGEGTRHQAETRPPWAERQQASPGTSPQ